MKKREGQGDSLHSSRRIFWGHIRLLWKDSHSRNILRRFDSKETSRNYRHIGQDCIVALKFHTIVPVSQNHPFCPDFSPCIYGHR